MGRLIDSTLIEIGDLAKVYQRGKQRVEMLHHVNLAIAEGDFLALMRPHCSGARRVPS